MNHRIWVLFSGPKKLLPKKAKRYCHVLQIIIQFYPSLALFRIIYVVFDPKSDRNGMSWDYLQLVDMFWGVRVLVPCFLFDSLTSSASIQNHITSSCGTLSTIVAEQKVIRPCVEITKNRWVVLSANEFPIEHLHAAILKEETAAFLQCFHTEAIHNSCQLHNLRRKNGQPVSRQGAARCELVKPWWTLGLMLCTVRKVYCDNIWQYILYSIIFYNIVSDMLILLQVCNHYRIIHWYPLVRFWDKHHANSCEFMRIEGCP